MMTQEVPEAQRSLVSDQEARSFSIRINILESIAWKYSCHLEVVCECIRMVDEMEVDMDL